MATTKRKRKIPPSKALVVVSVAVVDWRSTPREQNHPFERRCRACEAWTPISVNHVCPVEIAEDFAERHGDAMDAMIYAFMGIQK